MNGKQHRRSNAASPRWMAWVLLCLTAHAFLVSATHFHRVEGGQTRQPSAIAVSSPATNSQGLEASGDAECLLCRLQRNLVADLVNPAPQITAPPAQFFVFQTRTLAPLLRLSYLVPAGRAPPLV